MVGLGVLDFVGFGIDGEATSGAVVGEGGEGGDRGGGGEGAKAGVGSSKGGKVPVSSGA